jgi:hypothetical protein
MQASVAVPEAEKTSPPFSGTVEAPDALPIKYLPVPTQYLPPLSVPRSDLHWVSTSDLRNLEMISADTQRKLSFSTFYLGVAASLFGTLASLADAAKRHPVLLAIAMGVFAGAIFAGLYTANEYRILRSRFPDRIKEIQDTQGYTPTVHQKRIAEVGPEQRAFGGIRGAGERAD